MSITVPQSLEYVLFDPSNYPEPHNMQFTIIRGKETANYHTEEAAAS